MYVTRRGVEYRRCFREREWPVNSLELNLIEKVRSSIGRFASRVHLSSIRRYVSLEFVPRSVEAAAGPHQRGDRQSQRPTAPSLVHEAEALPASAHGPRVCVRQKSELLPAWSVILSWYSHSETTAIQLSCSLKVKTVRSAFHSEAPFIRGADEYEINQSPFSLGAKPRRGGDDFNLRGLSASRADYCFLGHDFPRVPYEFCCTHLPTLHLPGDGQEQLHRAQVTFEWCIPSDGNRTGALSNIPISRNRLRLIDVLLSPLVFSFTLLTCSQQLVSKATHAKAITRTCSLMRSLPLSVNKTETGALVNGNLSKDAVEHIIWHWNSSRHDDPLPLLRSKPPPSRKKFLRPRLHR
ncbi:hypothetical protein TNCV_1076611 [Trichonephila clavipes]|uniref:Uncharacterized protein n=1 Tax=Trichonephila clavipes TaxID=2585209 RepID=A0A8X6RVM8_TRICX|nr:hypothetical protein TNCV_1076611 [Trichonephila clavipes]